MTGSVGTNFWIKMFRQPFETDVFSDKHLSMFANRAQAPFGTTYTDRGSIFYGRSPKNEYHPLTVTLVARRRGFPKTTGPAHQMPYSFVKRHTYKWYMPWFDTYLFNLPGSFTKIYLSIQALNCFFLFASTTFFSIFKTLISRSFK